MAHKAPGKAHRNGISLVELFRIFPDDDSAQAWFEEQRWGGEPWCPHCGSFHVKHNPNNRSLPWRCAERECRKKFSVRFATPMQGSPLGYQTWVVAIYLLTTSLKGQSSMKLHRDLNITQKTAWFLAHRIRKTFAEYDGGVFSGPVEVDETYVGGKRKNMSNARRAELADTGCGTVGKTAVVGAKDRATKQVAARVVTDTAKSTLQGFVAEHAAPDATVYTDEASAYEGLLFAPTTPSSTALWSMSGAMSTPTARRASGRCSSALTWASTTK